MRLIPGLVLFEAAFFLAYHGAMTFSQAAASPFWFPDSILLCALLMAPPRRWWIFALAPLPIRLLVDVPPGMSAWFLLAAYAIDTAKSVLAATLLRRFIADPLRFASVRDVAAFGLIAVALVPALAATAGAAARAARGFDYAGSWIEWFLGNALTQVVVTPALLYWGVGARSRVSGSARRRGEAILLGLALAVAGYLAFETESRAMPFADPRIYAPVPLVIWAAMRFGLPGASGAIAVLAAFAVHGSRHSLGPMAGASPGDTTLALQLFLLLGVAPLYLVAVLIEQTREAERTLRESERRFRAMADSAPIMIWMSGVDKGCEFFNQGWLEFTGRTLEQERGDGWTRGVHAEDLHHCLEAYGASFDAREPFEVEYRLRRRDGAYRWILDRGTPRYGPAGEFLGYIGSALDVTDRRDIEEARRHLAHMSRLALVGELTAMVAHEVKQPLSAILMNADAARVLLARRDPPIEDLREIVGDIRLDDMRANDAINRIRGLLRKRNANMRLLDLDKVVGDVARLAQGDAVRRGFRLKHERAPGLPRVRADHVALQQVLLNLIVNAMDAMASVPAGTREITIGARAGAAGTVEAYVSDRGPGIQPDQVERIFDSFVTTKEEGMGLGLAISRSLIDAHGGRIWAENEDGGGATFRFALPAAHSDARAAQAPTGLSR